MTTAYHNDQAIKDRYVARMRAHIAADDLTRGIGWSEESRRGCAVGCTFDGYDHSLGPVEIGVPTELMHLVDAIFEGLPAADAPSWAVGFLESVPVGADLSLVVPRVLVWILTDPTHGVRQYASPSSVEAVDHVAGLWRRVVAGEPLPAMRTEFSAAAARAEEAAARAAARAAFFRALRDEVYRILKGGE